MRKALIIGLLLGVGLPEGLAADKSVISAIEKSGGLVLPGLGNRTRGGGISPARPGPRR